MRKVYNIECSEDEIVIAIKKEFIQQVLESDDTITWNERQGTIRQTYAPQVKDFKTFLQKVAEGMERTPGDLASPSYLQDFVAAACCCVIEEGGAGLEEELKLINEIDLRRE